MTSLIVLVTESGVKWIVMKVVFSFSMDGSSDKTNIISRSFLYLILWSLRTISYDSSLFNSSLDVLNNRK